MYSQKPLPEDAVIKAATNAVGLVVWGLIPLCIVAWLIAAVVGLFI